MPGWLSKAGNAFRKAPPEVEQTFAVACDCGAIHQGQRRSKPLKITCRDCGLTRFILARDVYPQPKEPPRVPAPIIVESMPVLMPSEKKTPTGKQPRGKDVVAEARPATKPITRPATPEFLVVPTSRKLLTPLRAVGLGIVLLLIGTGYFVVQKQRRDLAITTLREASDAAWKAVAESDWAVSRDQFERAIAAAKVLGRDDLAVRRLNAGFRESSALAELSSLSLSQIIAKAEKEIRDPERWQRDFQTHYQGRWLVLEAPLIRDAESWRIDYPVWTGSSKRTVRLELQSPALDDLNPDKALNGVVLAGQIERCELSENKKVWNVEFASESLFLWGLTETWPALNLTPDDLHPEPETSAVLERQQRMQRLLEK